MTEAYKIFDNFLDGVYIINREKDIIYANQVATTLFNLRIKRILGKKSYENFMLDTNELFCMEGGTSGENEPSGYIEVDFYSPKGANGTVQVMMQPDLLQNEEERWIIYFHDVTEERRLSHNVRKSTRAKEAAQEKIFKIQDDLKEFTEMALKDEMTGLGNYRFFNNEIIKELNTAMDSKKPLGLVILDVDKFKVFNDTYGHQQGDEVLRYVGKAIADTVRRYDIPARYGGEEFVLILPDTNEPGVMVACEKVRKAIESTKVPYLAKDGEFLSVTASLGGICIDPETLAISGVTDQKIFIEEADKNLYKAKESGRNCTVVSMWSYNS